MERFEVSNVLALKDGKPVKAEVFSFEIENITDPDRATINKLVEEKILEKFDAAVVLDFTYDWEHI